jgi:hypothetical protein
MDYKDYKPWVQTKLSPKFHSDPEDDRESELRTVIEDFIKVGNQLDVLKKNKFYGRVKGHPNHVESGVEVRPSDSNFIKESEDEQLLHAIIGMATETVEMLEAIYASKWKGEEFDTVNFFEEMGDLEFYRSIPFNNLDWTEKQVRDTNYFKLEKRYPEGYTDNSANNRDLESEREILEKGLSEKVTTIIDEPVILVFYLNVGNLEECDVQESIEKIKHQFRFKDEKFLSFFIPVRNQDSKVECIYPVLLDDTQKSKVKKAIQRLEKEIPEISYKFIYVALTSFDAFHGIKVPARFENLMREIESTYDEMIEGVFTDYDEYRSFEVECASQARHGSNGTTEYESLKTDDLTDLFDVEKEQIIKLESYKFLTFSYDV